MHQTQDHCNEYDRSHYTTYLVDYELHCFHIFGQPSCHVHSIIEMLYCPGSLNSDTHSDITLTSSHGRLQVEPQASESLDVKQVPR